MARGREQHIEHLLRRAAFGAVEEDVTRYAAIPFNAAVDRLLSFERFPDDVDDKIGTPGYVGVTARAAAASSRRRNIDDARQRWLFRMVHSAAAAPGEDGALLAQPLRDRLLEDRRRVRRRRGHADARGEAVRGPGRRRRSARAVRGSALRQLPRPARRGGAGSGDAGVARRTARTSARGRRRTSRAS